MLLTGRLLSRSSAELAICRAGGGFSIRLDLAAEAAQGLGGFVFHSGLVAENSDSVMTPQSIATSFAIFSAWLPMSVISYSTT